MFKDVESDIGVRIGKMGNLTRKTAESDVTLKQTAGS